MTSKEEKFYLRDSKTGKYHSIYGLVCDKNTASQFTDIQVKRRYGVAKTHHNILRTKLQNAGVIMEPVVKRETGIKILSDIPYQEDDILICSGEFNFTGGVILEDMVIYTPYRNILRKPKRGKGELRLVVLTVRKISGKCIR